MKNNMTWFFGLDEGYQKIVITSLTTLLVFIAGWVIRIIYERRSLNYKLKIEYEFAQRRKLKEEIAQNKIRLLNSAEEFNHRLWNFSQHVNEGWHNVSEEEWNQSEHYYIKSFVYRFLKFLFWVLKNLNVLRCCHLIIIQFLNTFGHDYQKTECVKIDRITELYKTKLKIKKGWIQFIKKSKLEKELKCITDKISKA